MRVVVGIVGALVVAGVFRSMVATLVSTTQRRPGQRDLTWVVGRTLGRLFGLVAGRIRDEGRRETVQAGFAPSFVLALLTTWIALQVLGWGLVWWAFGGTEPVLSLGDAMYFSGVVYFTVGFGEVVPVGDLARWFALLEAFGGVTVVALVIGYLPTLYGAYTEREVQLSRLDDGSEERITPLSLGLEMWDGHDVASLDPFYAEWEVWISTVLQSHTTHPMLAYFRSQDPQQSWVTALGLVTDTAVSSIVLTDRETGPAYRTYRRAVRLFRVVCESLGVEPYDEDPITEELFRIGYDAWVEAGLPVDRSFEDSYAHLRRLRSAYAGHLEALIDALHAPRGFWGHRIGHVGAGRDAVWDAGRRVPPTD